MTNIYSLSREQERLRADEARDALKESHFQCQQVLDQCNQLRLDNKEKEEVMAGANNSLKRKLEEEKQKAALVASGLQEELQQLRVKFVIKMDLFHRLVAYGFF